MNLINKWARMCNESLTDAQDYEENRREEEIYKKLGPEALELSPEEQDKAMEEYLKKHPEDKSDDSADDLPFESEQPTDEAMSATDILNKFNANKDTRDSENAKIGIGDGAIKTIKIQDVEKTDGGLWVKATVEYNNGNSKTKKFPVTLDQINLIKKAMGQSTISTISPEHDNKEIKAVIFKKLTKDATDEDAAAWAKTDFNKMDRDIDSTASSTRTGTQDDNSSSSGAFAHVSDDTGDDSEDEYDEDPSDKSAKKMAKKAGYSDDDIATILDEYPIEQDDSGESNELAAAWSDTNVTHDQYVELLINHGWSPKRAQKQAADRDKALSEN